MPITNEPEQLWQQAQTMIDKGWANNMNELVSESVRRYLESHQVSITERFIREEVE